VTASQQRLHGFEPRGEAELGRNRDPGARGEPEYGILRQILNPGAAVAGPLGIESGVGGEIERGEGELAQPAHEMTVRIDVAGGEAGAEGEAENGLIVEAHGAGERGDVAVVGNGDGNVAPAAGDVEIQSLDAAIEELGRDFAEEGGDAGAVVDVN